MEILNYGVLLAPGRKVFCSFWSSKSFLCLQICSCALQRHGRCTVQPGIAAQHSNALVLIAVSPEFPMKKKKGWQVPSLLLLHVLADFSTSCSLEPLPSALLMPWGSPTTPSSWRASLCNQFPSDFLAELCRKNVGFLAFCPSLSPADERELFMHENTQFASKLPLPSISNPSKRGDFAILCFD